MSSSCAENREFGLERSESKSLSLLKRRSKTCWWWVQTLSTGLGKLDGNTGEGLMLVSNPKSVIEFLPSSPVLAEFVGEFDNGVFAGR